MVLHITLSRGKSVYDKYPVMFVLASVYRPPGHHTDFIKEFELVLAADKFLIAGDFNIPVDNEKDALKSAFRNILNSIGFRQHVSEPTHCRYHTLDVILSHGTDAGYTMDAWERWRIVCLAALSVEDIEDIYLFGTMITGLLLIGLGFALGYRKIQKTGTAVQSLTRLPAMTEAVGRAVSIETETINRNMDSIMEKLTALQKKIDDRDQNGQRE